MLIADEVRALWNISRRSTFNLQKLRAYRQRVAETAAWFRTEVKDFGYHHIGQFAGGAAASRVALFSFSFLTARAMRMAGYESRLARS